MKHVNITVHNGGRTSYLAGLSTNR